MALPSGTRVVVSVQDSASVFREFLSADDATVTLRIGSAMPGAPAMIETIARIKVVEIRTPRMAERRGIWGALGGAGGFFGGAIAGGMAGSLIGKARGADPSDLRGVFWGTLGGGIAGAAFGATGHRPQEELIYRRARITR